MFIGVHGGDVVRAGGALTGVVVLSLDEGMPDAARLTLQFTGALCRTRMQSALTWALCRDRDRVLDRGRALVWRE